MLNISSLKRKKMEELFRIAENMNVETYVGITKQILIFRLIEEHSKLNGMLFGDGVLEIVDSYGFLRSPVYNYEQGPDDIYVAPNQISKFNLRNGDIVSGQIRPPKEGEKYFALLRVDNINYLSPENSKKRITFENLIPLHPDRKFNIETNPDEISTRIVDIVSPIGMGQRGLIVAPPFAGKTVLLQKLSNAILTNHKEAKVIILLIDERPEEVTDMKRMVKGPVEVVSSTFDEAPEHHIHLAEIVIEKAKKLCENNFDVVILLDSMTRLARAYNAVTPNSGKILSGGMDSNALIKPKQFFGAARNTEDGGSLTIIATTLVDTGSRMDDLIYEEFKGTGNMELYLDRDMFNRRIFPAIDIKRSGTRREELMRGKEMTNKIWILKKYLSQMDTIESLQFLKNEVKKYKTNQMFVENMNKI